MNDRVGDVKKRVEAAARALLQRFRYKGIKFAQMIDANVRRRGGLYALLSTSQAGPGKTVKQ